MFDWLKSLFRARAPDERAGVPVSETEDGRTWASIADRKCPACGAAIEGVYEGPSGGASTNIQLDPCGHWFNATPLLGIAQRIRDR